MSNSNDVLTSIMKKMAYTSFVLLQHVNQGKFKLLKCCFCVQKSSAISIQTFIPLFEFFLGSNFDSVIFNTNLKIEFMTVFEIGDFNGWLALIMKCIEYQNGSSCSQSIDMLLSGSLSTTPQRPHQTRHLPCQTRSQMFCCRPRSLRPRNWPIRTRRNLWLFTPRRDWFVTVQRPLSAPFEPHIHWLLF